MKYITLTIGIICATFSMTHAQDVAEIISTKYSPYLNAVEQQSAALIQKDGDIRSFSIGESQTGQTVDANSVFNIGSATKTMTATLILQEVQNGRMSLRDPISKYLDPLPNVDGNITIEEMLRHESGLGELVGANYLELAFGDADPLSRQEVLQLIPEAYENKDMRYTNTNYILLGHILESVTGQPYYNLIQTRIFDACDMQDSYPYLTLDISNLATPRHNGASVLDSVNEELYEVHAYSAGSVASTLIDMNKFYRHLYETNELIDRAHFQQMITSNADTSELSQYGLGLITVNHKDFTFYAHGGDNIGYSFRNYYDPNSKNMVLLFGNELMFDFNYEMQQDLLNCIKAKRISPGQKIANTVLEMAAGEYIAPEIDFEFTFTEREGLPYIDALGSPQALLVDGDTLYNKMLDLRIVLDSLDSGSMDFSFNEQQCRAYRPDYLPAQYRNLVEIDLSRFSPYRGTFAIKDIGVELEIREGENELFLVAQGTELKLQEGGENTLSCSMMGIDMDFDFADSTSFIFKQAGQEFLATRVD